MKKKTSMCKQEETVSPSIKDGETVSHRNISKV
jgi:hypothetical protein